MSDVADVMCVDQTALEEAVAFNKDLTERLRALPDAWSFPPSVTRERRLQGYGAFPIPTYSERAQEIEIDGPAGPLTLRRFPSQSGASSHVIFHMHGGGFVFGSASEQDPRLDKLAQTLDVDVVSIEYRLAPEHPYPAGLEDCVSACLWGISEGAKTYGWSDFAVTGDSAGAGLAVLTALRLRDDHGMMPFKAMVLVGGWLDLSLTPSARLWGDAFLFPSTRDLKMFVRHYLASEEDPQDPCLSPLYARLDGLPPTLLSVGTDDPLIEDSLFFASRLKSVGSQSFLQVYPHGCHVFQGFDLALANLSNQRINEFLNTNFIRT